MNRRTFRSFAAPMLIGGSTFALGLAWLAPSSDAGDFFRRRTRPNPAPAPTVVDTRPENRLQSSGMLGTFQSTPTIQVRANGVIGGGYSPIGLYGENNAMTLFGPISSLRETSAPVNTVVRGYNGIPAAVQGESYSAPFQPNLSPVKYPTRASTYTGPRVPSYPYGRASGIMWVDQN